MPFVAPKERSRAFFIMYYVYLLRSLKDPNNTYSGYTTDLQQRLEKHNSGSTIYSSDDRPWKLVSYIFFDEESKALKFEKYLKKGSGHAFARKRLW